MGLVWFDRKLGFHEHMKRVAQKTLKNGLPEQYNVEPRWVKKKSERDPVDEH